MTEASNPRQGQQPTWHRHRSYGALFLGVVILMLGVLWLLGELRFIVFGWDLVLPVLFVAIGVYLLARFVGGGHREWW